MDFIIDRRIEIRYDASMNRRLRVWILLLLGAALVTSAYIIGATRVPRISPTEVHGGKDEIDFKDALSKVDYEMGDDFRVEL
ncbi:MAG: hypothetical protein AAF585_09985, partial [Verrucomicrobiota bacterium]